MENESFINFDNFNMPEGTGQNWFLGPWACEHIGELDSIFRLDKHLYKFLHFFYNRSASKVPKTGFKTLFNFRKLITDIIKFL